MNILLKKAIVDYVFENRDNFQLTNTTIEHFKEYIYDDKGDYLLGGADVANFVDEAIKLARA